MKKHIPTNESGRSMVEMLGVLAIMGVLSIGAVAGYRWAMDKYEANEILNEVRKRAITSSQARISGHEIDLTEYGDNGRINGKYDVVADNAYNGDSRLFTLTVSDIPQGVCDKVIDVNWQMPAAILLDGVAVDDNTVCGEGNNEMLFAFANDLKSGAVAGEEGEETPDPNKEHCWGHGTWDGTSCACEAGWSGDDCSMTQFCDKNGTCYDCSYSSSPSTTAEECAKCDDSSTPRVLLEHGYCALESCGANQFQNTTGYCRSCSDSYSTSALEDECAKCDDSGTPRFWSTDGNCYPCSNSYGVSATEVECAKCDSSSTPRVLLENGYCVLESCGTNQFRTTSGSCYSCSYSYGLAATAAGCAMCDDSSTPREMRNGICIIPGYCPEGFLSDSGSCIRCSYSYGVSATEVECAKCDSTDTPRVLLENGYCALESCGANQFQNTNGTCYRCSESYGVSATAAECAKCDDSSTPREMKNGYCIIPGYCPEGFLSSYGSCLSCSESFAHSATAAGCAMCDGTNTPRVLLENGYCALESCGANQFQNTYGHCTSCSISWGQEATAAECAKCDSTDTPRHMMDNGECALVCGVNQFQDSDGYCRSCSISWGESATEAECAKCDKSSTPRYMNGSRCYKCPTSLSSASLNTKEKCQSCRGTWDAGTQKCS